VEGNVGAKYEHGRSGHGSGRLAGWVGWLVGRLKGTFPSFTKRIKKEEKEVGEKKKDKGVGWVKIMISETD